jgi:5'-AMP-activated protein kinase catalytic alpha subunit
MDFFQHKDYKVIRKINSGATSDVVLALHMPSRTSVAIKLISKKKLKNSVLTSKFSQCVSTLKSMSHPFIAKYYDAFETANYFAIVLEYCNNGTLEDFIKKHKYMDENKARVIFAQIFLAIEYLHNNLRILHRDIKAKNILFDKNNNVKVIDFGLAADFTNSNPLFTTFCGTPYYIAPEMVNASMYTTKADIWSLGVLLHFMIDGKLPFNGQTIKEIYQKMLYSDPGLVRPASAELSDLIGKMLTKNPEQRPSITQVLNHDWLNHGDLINSLRANIKSFNDYVRCAPRFHSLSEKIQFYEKWRDSFHAGKETIDIPEECSAECVSQSFSETDSAMNVSRELLLNHRMLKKSLMNPPNIVEFPKRKSYI